MTFNTSDFLPLRLYEEITATRIDKPELIAAAAERRVKAENLTYDGKLTLLAVDQPARRATAAAGDPLALGDRFELLGRALRVLSSEFDGVVASVDVMEELLILDQLITNAGGESVLDDTLLIASINNGGLAGSAWEMNDRLTSFSSDSVSRLRLDGISVRWRFDLNDEGSGETLSYVAGAIEEVERLGQSLPVFVAPQPVRHAVKGYEAVSAIDDLVKAAGVVSALGSTSANTWLVLPPVDEFARLARATTLPVLLLGDDADAAAPAMLAAFAAGMAAGRNVRGTLSGTSVLFPADGDDPAAVAHAVEAIVHDGADAETAWAAAADARGNDREWLNRLFK